MSKQKYKIAATLTYGKKLPVILCILSGMEILFFLTMLPICIYEFVTSMDKAFFFISILLLFLTLIFLYIMYIYLRQSRDIKKWLKDAVLLPAQAMELGRIENGIIYRTKIKISIKFFYNEQKIIQKSGAKNKIKENLFYINVGYDAIFLKYIDREIKILYSPKYDEVMILKDKKNAPKK